MGPGFESLKVHLEKSKYTNVYLLFSFTGTFNVIDAPAYAQELAAIKQRMLEFYMETGDFVPTRMDKR